MKVSKLNHPEKLVSLSYKKYAIDWQTDGASKIEVKFRDLIFPFWKNRIVLFQPRIPGSLLRLDFLCVNNRICVEIDGEQHGSFNKHFHNNSRNTYLASIKRDLGKEKWLESNNIRLVRLNKEDLDNFSIKYVEDKTGISLI